MFQQKSCFVSSTITMFLLVYDLHCSFDIRCLCSIVTSIINEFLWEVRGNRTFDQNFSVDACYIFSVSTSDQDHTFLDSEDVSLLGLPTWIPFLQTVFLLKDRSKTRIIFVPLIFEGNSLGLMCGRKWTDHKLKNENTGFFRVQLLHVI